MQRLVRSDGTVSYAGRFFEVPYELAGKTVQLIVDPHTRSAIGVEDDAGADLGAATPLDALANTHRRRVKPGAFTPPTRTPRSAPTLIDLACAEHYSPIAEDEPGEDPTSEGA